MESNTNPGESVIETSMSQNFGHPDEERRRSNRRSSFQMLNGEKFQFKRSYPLEKRMQWSEEAREKYATKLPIVVEKDIRCTSLDDLSNSK